MVCDESRPEDADSPRLVDVDQVQLVIELTCTLKPSATDRTRGHGLRLEMCSKPPPAGAAEMFTTMSA